MFNYDFYKMFVVEEIVQCLCKMQELGVDILKIVVMLQIKVDVLILFIVIVEMQECYVDCLIIIMLMLKIGVIFCFVGEVFGFVVMFGLVKKVFVLG